MHEALLCGQVPASRHEQLLNILAGIAAMQPQRVIERHLVFRPNRQRDQRVQVGGSQNVMIPAKKQQEPQIKDLYFMQLVQKLDPEGNGAAQQSKGPKPEDRKPWSLVFNDTPEPGKKPATLRMIQRTEMIEGDGADFMTHLGYRYVSEYVLEGHRLIHNNIILLLYRILRLPQSGQSQPLPDNSVPAMSSLSPLDESGAYVLEASVRVQDGNKPDIVSMAFAELTGFRDLMRGVIDMRALDRLSFDSRAR